MGIRKTGWFIVFVVLLCALLMVLGLGSRKAIKEVIRGDKRDSLSWILDEGMEELLWNYCEQDLIQMKEVIEDCDLCIPGKTYCSVNDIVTKSPSLAKDKIQKAMIIHHPKIKQIVSDCLIKKNLLLRFHGEEGESMNGRIPYLESIFLKPDIPRRVLISDLLETESIGETPAPAPSPYVQSPMLSPSPSPDSAPSGSQPPDASPTSTPYINTSQQPQSDDLTSASPSPGSTEQSTKKNSSHKSVIIAVAVTASSTFVIVALLFMCYTKVLKNGRRQNDERPLLSLSLSDYSISSSHKSFALGNPTNPEKISNDPYGASNTISSQNRKDSALNGTYYSETGTLNTFLSQPLPPAPNGGVANHSVDMSNSFSGNRAQVPQPALKPPPGRMEISPPEVPSPELFPSSFKANPPPPIPARPAPPAPSSLKPASGAGPRPPGPPPPMPPKPPGLNSGPRPPPPPKGGLAPPRPPAPMGLGPKSNRPPPGPNHPSNSVPSADDESEASKAKLKPFFWDKVMANPDQSMVWHQIKSGSFQFNEEMIENLFGYAAPEKKNDNKKESLSERPSQFIQLIDPKKAQNLAILLRAMNVTTEEVCDALQEGNELPIEFLQTLLKMAPTSEEELKLRLFAGELTQLGPAERFLKAMVEIPFAFKRLESLLFMSSLQEEVSSIKESFSILEVACKELRNSRLFLKLLEAVLKTGNRMNNGTFRGGAQAFKLDTLLKLSDVKGTDGKTTLLHFVVQEIIRSEGVRAARTTSTGASLSASSIKSDDFVDETPDDTEEHFRNLGLQVVSGLSSELENVKKVANLDADSISGTVIKLGQSLVKTRDFMNSEIKRSEEETGFRQTLKSFVQNAEVDIVWLLEEERRIMALVKSTGDYFHGNAGKDDGLRLFVIVRDFLIMVDKSCKEVAQKRPVRSQKKEISATPSSSNLHPPSSPDLRPRLFPAVADRRVDSSSSDDD